MRVCVTGGAGFIGSHVCESLYGRGFDVVAIDNMYRPSPYGLEVLKVLGIRIARVDVRDLSRVEEVVCGCDVVVHGAALIDARESLEVPELYMDVNAVGTAVVAKACAKRGVEKVILLSSAAVYGEPTYLPIDEAHPTNPVNPYGVSKLAAEKVLESMSRGLGLRYVVLRLFNVYGPGQSLSYAGLIPNTIRRLLRGEPPIIYGDGNQTRDFIYVKDVANVIELCIEKDLSNEVLNVGSGREIRVVDVVKEILSILKMDLEPVYQPPRPGDVRRSCANIAKMKRLLGYEPRTSLSRGLRETASYFIESVKGLRS